MELVFPFLGTVGIDRIGDLISKRTRQEFREYFVGTSLRIIGDIRTFEWTPAMRAAVDMAREARPIDIAPWLFCTKHGAGYFNEENGQATGWDSMWQRFMTRLLKDTKITERFTEHDLCRKAGSDEDSLERARQLLGHADAKITKRAYRTKPELVRPASPTYLKATRNAV